MSGTSRSAVADCCGLSGRRHRTPATKATGLQGLSKTQREPAVTVSRRCRFTGGLHGLTAKSLFLSITANGVSREGFGLWVRTLS